MYTPKPLSREALEPALAKADRYRFLNEPAEAESIALDILATDPGHQRALTTLLLAITDQFFRELGPNVPRAVALLPRLEGDYAQAYYRGMIAERRAKALLIRAAPGSGETVFEGLREAMDCYEAAEKIRPAGNDDAILRWNACARLISSRKDLHPAEPSAIPAQLE